MSKDVMYCDDIKSISGRSVRSCFALMRELMCKWLAPVMKVAVMEAWETFNTDSIFVQKLESLDRTSFALYLFLKLIKNC